MSAPLAAIFPLAYLLLTLIRGPIVDFYPYPCLAVGIHGYGRVLINSVGMVGLKRRTGAGGRTRGSSTDRIFVFF